MRFYFVIVVTVLCARALGALCCCDASISCLLLLSHSHAHTLVLIIRQRRTVNLILKSPEQPRVVGSSRLSGTALGLLLKQFFFCSKRHQAAIIYSLLKQVGAALRCGVDLAIPCRI